MSLEKAKAADSAAGGLLANSGAGEQAQATGKYVVECFDKDGNLKWVAESKNLVVNQGLQDMNTKYFKGATYTAAWYLGLITGPGSSTTIAASDTLASKAWTEDTNYAGNRKAVTFGTATTANPSVISNSASPAQYSMTGTTTIAGAFLCSVATGTSGILFSASDFQSPGDRAVVNGDTLNVTYQFSLDAL